MIKWCETCQAERSHYPRAGTCRSCAVRGRSGPKTAEGRARSVAAAHSPEANRRREASRQATRAAATPPARLPVWQAIKSIFAAFWR